MQSKVSESQLVVPATKGKLLMENTFGALTMDRSGLLYGINILPTGQYSVNRF